MNGPPPVNPITLSVIVVSRGRPAELALCLRALTQQDHPQIEVIVVADPGGLAAAAPFAVKPIAFDEANISAARNAGLAQAAGDVVAFIDDDAVAEPSWAGRLAAPLADPQVVAATGYTRGRNGISWQWMASGVDATGFDHPLPPVRETVLHPGQSHRAVKPVGTNCAFRRAALLQVGGFDPAYRFYLEDADIGLRLAALGKTAVVPGAVVHHAFAASDRRRADRVPTDLHQIGASARVFLRRHADPAQWPVAMERLRAEQAARLRRLQAAGQIDTAEVARLSATLEAGLAEGAVRDLPALLPLNQTAPTPFRPLPGTGPRPGRVIAGRIWQAGRLRRTAAEAAGRGEIVTLFLFGPSPRKHRHRYRAEGFWEQSGGLFGPSNRDQPRLSWWRLDRRVAFECARIGDVRPFGPEIPPRKL